MNLKEIVSLAFELGGFDNSETKVSSRLCRDSIGPRQFSTSPRYELADVIPGTSCEGQVGRSISSKHRSLLDVRLRLNKDEAPPTMSYPQAARLTGSRSLLSIRD